LKHILLYQKTPVVESYAFTTGQAACLAILVAPGMVQYWVYGGVWD